MADLDNAEVHQVSKTSTKQGRIYCLAEAPSGQAVNQVHKEAHGLVAEEVFQVQEGA